MDVASDDRPTRSRYGLHFHAAVLSVDGSQWIGSCKQQLVSSAAQAEEFGMQVAQDLVDQGAGEILQAIVLNRKIVAEQGGA